MNGCMETGKRIQILMSTYNGAAYLKEQVDSILNQQQCRVQISLLIRDDGSSDGTCALLRALAQRENVQVEYGDHVGITDSYMWLFAHSDRSCDYFGLSDQDDVWLPNKLQTAMEYLAGEPSEVPLLFASITHLVDAQLEDLGDSALPRRGVSYYNAMVQNVLPGHTQVFNRALLELVSDRGCSDVHVMDWWFYLVAASMGKVLFYPAFTVLHRQHGSNAVGATVNPLKSVLRRIRYIKNGRGNAFSLQLKSFYERYREDMPREYRQETERFLSGLQSVWTRIRYGCTCKAYRQTAMETLIFKGLYILGKYNCEPNTHTG